jgi:hypothetical protein
MAVTVTVSGIPTVTESKHEELITVDEIHIRLFKAY